jgi:hypothetical protein
MMEETKRTGVFIAHDGLTLLDSGVGGGGGVLAQHDEEEEKSEIGGVLTVHVGCGVGGGVLLLHDDGVPHDGVRED